MENRGFLKNIKRVFGIFFTTMVYVTASERLFTTDEEMDYYAEMLSKQIDNKTLEK